MSLNAQWVLSWKQGMAEFTGSFETVDPPNEGELIFLAGFFPYIPGGCGLVTWVEDLPECEIFLVHVHADMEFPETVATGQPQILRMRDHSGEDA